MGKRKKRIKGQGKWKQEAEKALCEVRVLGMKKQMSPGAGDHAIPVLLSNLKFHLPEKRGSHRHQAKVLTDLVALDQTSCTFLQSPKGTVPP